MASPENYQQKDTSPFRKKDIIIFEGEIARALRDQERAAFIRTTQPQEVILLPMVPTPLRETNLEF